MSDIPDQTDTLGLTRTIRLSYWLAVALIAMLATASFWIVDHQVRQQSADRELIRIVGEQETLSQHIASLAQAASGSDAANGNAATEKLRERIAEFRANHDRLLAAARPGDGPATQIRQELSALLMDPPFEVDLHVRDMIDGASRIAEAGDGAQPAPITASAAKAALAGYEEIHRLFEQNATASVTDARLVYWLLYSAMLLILASTVLFIFRPMIRHVTQRTQQLAAARNDMAYLAAHDRLTGLRNRMFLTDHFELMVEGARRRNERVAVLHLDLDNFKSVNDTYGHAAGDCVLQTVAARIKSVVRAADIPARIGGDEFIILLSGPGTGVDVADIAGRVLEEIDQPIEFDGTVFTCGASIGISIFPDDADKPEDLLIDSDLALYRAKNAGRGCIRFFSSDLRQEYEFRRALEGDLRNSLENGEILVHYQPQVSLFSARVTGIEALARWNRNGRDLVPPDVFIPVAVKSGLMDAIGRHVISNAIAQAAEWHRNHTNFGRIAINAAGSELMKDDFVPFILGEASRHGLPTDKLAVEIAEDVILESNTADATARLRALRQAGVFIELDNFGTGHASLANINATEIDRLKIDRRLVQGLDADKGRRRIVRALVELAKGLDIAVVAEGAETIGEMETLREIGCGNVQGYGVAYPMEAKLLTKWLHIHAPGTPIPLFEEDKVRA